MHDFDVIYRKYAVTVKKYVMSLGADDSLSDDITADTFLKAIKNSDKYNEKYSMLTWLCTIAKRTYYDYCRKKDNAALPLDEEMLIVNGGAEREIENNEQKLLLHKSILKLESPYKDVIYLRVFADLSFSEIGQILSKNENWARVTYYRGKMRLKELMEDEN